MTLLISPSVSVGFINWICCYSLCYKKVQQRIGNWLEFTKYNQYIPSGMCISSVRTQTSTQYVLYVNAYKYTLHIHTYYQYLLDAKLDPHAGLCVCVGNHTQVTPWGGRAETLRTGVAGQASAFVADIIWVPVSYYQLTATWFRLFLTCMLALIAEGGSVTIPAPAAWPDSRQQDRPRGVCLSMKHCQTQGEKGDGWACGHMLPF